MRSSCIGRGLGVLAATATLSAALVGAVATPATATSGAVPEANAAGPFLPGPPQVFGKAPGTASDETMAVRISRAEATDRVLPEAIEYFAETYGVSEAVATRRLATQGMVPDAGPVLERVLGDDYTDVWWDNEAGELVVVATDEAQGDEIDAALRDRGLADRDYRVERVGYDADALYGAAEATTRQLAPLATEGLARVSVGRGTVTVTLASAASAEQRAAVRAQAQRVRAADAAPPVVVETSEQRSLTVRPTTWCQDSGGRYCDQIIGGAQFYNARAGCTWAYFVSWTGRSPFVPSMLTAGHCLNKEPTVSNQYTCRPGGVNCGAVGLSLQYYYGYGRSDVGMIDMYAAGWQFYGGWWNWSPVTYTALSSWFTSSPGVGYVVCKNGAVSGSTCGSVSASTSSPYYARDNVTLSNMIEISGMTTCYGDSGSPVSSASVTWGVGIHSGASIPTGSNCGSTTSYTSPLWEADYYLNLDIHGGGPHGPYA